jgi:hypothetical protein
VRSCTASVEHLLFSEHMTATALYRDYIDVDEALLGHTDSSQSPRQGLLKGGTDGHQGEMANDLKPAGMFILKPGLFGPIFEKIDAF